MPFSFHHGTPTFQVFGDFNAFLSKQRHLRFLGWSPYLARDPSGGVKDDQPVPSG
jgi:hypothetical protein